MGKHMDEKIDNPVNPWPCGTMCSIVGQCVSSPVCVCTMMNAACMETVTETARRLISHPVSFSPSFSLPEQFHPNSSRNWPLIYPKGTLLHFHKSYFIPPPTPTFTPHLTQPPTATRQLMGLFTRRYNLINFGGNNFLALPGSGSTKTEV